MHKDLRAELSQGSSLRACRDALEAAGHPWKLLSGTLVFVHPAQYRAAISALSLCELRPYHIVFADSLGYLIDETLAHFKGSWMAACAPVPEEQIASASQVGATSDSDFADGDQPHLVDETSGASEQDIEWVVSVHRTFLCLVPACASLEAHVTSSSADAHCSGHINPRILALQRASLWQC
jgi:hypothetical protein